MKIGRNDPCPCGSGKKYKKCCLNRDQSSQRSSINNTPNIDSLTIKERNLVLFNAIDDIFGFNKGKTWEDLKKEISGEQIREFYKVVASLWPRETDLISLLPKPDNRLRALYIGYYRPELVLRSIMRYSLYTDEIITIMPLINPWCVCRDYNPIEVPEQYREDTLRSLAFIGQIIPWVYAGIVNLIPDPGDFDYELRCKTWDLAQERVKKRKLTPRDVKEVAPYMFEDLKRDFLRLPEDALTTRLKKWMPKITQREIEEMLKYIDKYKKKDPLFLNQPIKRKESQLLITRTGVNLEMGLYIAQITGAYLYTDLSIRWKEILSTANRLPAGGDVWSPLTHAFQKLQFKFLNSVDPDFACSLKKDGRLESFRVFLRKIWMHIEGSPDLSEADKLARDFSDELKDEYNKGEVEWREIDKKLVKWTTGTGGIAAILTGGMSWEIPAAGFCIAAIGELLAARMERTRFKKTMPMSAFLDLQRRSKK